MPGRRRTAVQVLLVMGAVLAGVSLVALPSGQVEAVMATAAVATFLAMAIALHLDRVSVDAAIAAGLAVGYAVFMRRIWAAPVRDAGQLAALEYLAFRGSVLLTGAAFIGLGRDRGLLAAALGFAGVVASTAAHVAMVGGEGFRTAYLALNGGIVIVMFRLLASTVEELRGTVALARDDARTHLERSHLDDLTGLANRRRMTAVLQAAVDRAGRGDAHDAAVMFDLDGFKAVNDGHGHATGDAVLVRSARAVAGALRDRDVLGRWGGEEFLVVLTDADLVEATGIAERCRRAVAEAEGEPPCTASFGVTPIAAGDTLDDVLRRADVAMYAAKEAGRDRVEVG